MEHGRWRFARRLHGQQWRMAKCSETRYTPSNGVRGHGLGSGGDRCGMAEAEATVAEGERVAEMKLGTVRRRVAGFGQERCYPATYVVGTIGESSSTAVGDGSPVKAWAQG